MDHDAIAAYEAAYPIEIRMHWCEKFDATRHADAAAMLRTIVETLGIPKDCHRSRCRRARHCLMPKVDCAFAHAGWIEVEIMPKLAAALRRREREGTSLLPQAGEGGPGVSRDRMRGAVRSHADRQAASRR